MKTCTGNKLHPGDTIKFDGDWCPMCKLALILENRDGRIYVLERLKYSEVVKPSRRRDDVRS